MSADYMIVLERAEGNLSAYCPDLPGVAATGDTEDECAESMREAIAFHIEGLKRASSTIRCDGHNYLDVEGASSRRHGVPRSPQPIPRPGVRFSPAGFAQPG